MSKIYKMEFYIVDCEDKFSYTGGFEDMISELTSPIDNIELMPFNVQQKVFEWDDEIAINFTNATQSDYDEYFK
jgi:hypothetical protein